MKLRPLFVTAGVVLAAMVVLSVWAWPQIPDNALVPVHWGSDGRPDGFASKPWGLFGLPLVTLGLVALLAVVPRFEPRRDNLVRSQGAYVTVSVATLLFMGVVHVVAVLAALGRQVNIGVVMMVAASVLFVVVGGVLGRVQSSWLFGVRTPWTLSSELSWRRTHDAGVFVFAGLGVLSLVATFVLGPETAVWFMLAGLGVGASVLVVFSYVVWRSDPDRVGSGFRSVDPGSDSVDSSADPPGAA